MPFYDYICKDCGQFELLLPLAQSGSAQNCPKCAKLAKRTIISCPSFLSMSKARKKAYAINEKSANEPYIASAAVWNKKPLKEKKATGKKTDWQVSPRKWMIGH